MDLGLIELKAGQTTPRSREHAMMTLYCIFNRRWSNTRGEKEFESGLTVRANSELANRLCCPLHTSVSMCCAATFSCMTMMNNYREQLCQFLKSCSTDDLLRALSSEWLEEIVPGIGRVVGCQQGATNHCEGDVAVHTALVFENLMNVCPVHLGRKPDFVERVAAVIHDFKKPLAQHQHPNGDITFEGHEELAAAEIGALSDKLGLTASERAKLYFLVAEHGHAHHFAQLPFATQTELQMSPYVESLCAFQKADALGCRSSDGGHLPVLWDKIMPEQKCG